MTVESPGLVPESPGASPGDVVACGDFCWVEPYVCQDCCSVDVNDADPRLRETARLWASRFLWTATGKQYGGGPRTDRPLPGGGGPVVNCYGGYPRSGVAARHGRVRGAG